MAESFDVLTQAQLHERSCGKISGSAVIASTKVADPTADGYNFLLQIPLSSTATDSTAAVGDDLNCVLVQDSGLSLAVSPIKVGEANTVSKADTAIELKPRRALRSVAAVNRALAAEGAAPDARIGNLLSDNALAVNSATVSHLEVSGTVDAPTEKVEVAPLTVGAGERTQILRGGGVSVVSREPGYIFEFSTAINNAENFFGNVLQFGDHSSPAPTTRRRTTPSAWIS